MGEPNNIEDKLRDKLNSREFVIKDSWQADIDAKLDAYNSGRGKAAWFWVFGLVTLTFLVGAVSYMNWESQELSDFSPRENATETLTDEFNKDKNSSTNQKNAASASELNEASSDLSATTENAQVETRNTSSDNTQQPNAQDEALAENKEDRQKTSADSGVLAGQQSANRETSSKGTSTVSSTENSKTPKTGTPDSDPIDPANASKTQFQDEDGQENAIDDADSPRTQVSEAQNSGNEKTSDQKTDSKTPIEAEPEDQNPADPLADLKTGSNNNSNKSDLENKASTQNPSSDDNRGFQNASLLKESAPPLSALDPKFSLLPLAGNMALQNNSPFVPELTKSKKIWELSVLGGLGMSFLDQSSFLENQSGLEERSDISNLYSSQLDIRISRRAVNNTIGLQTGLSLTTYGENITYENYSETTSSTSLEFFETEVWTFDTILIDSMMFTIDSTLVLELDSMEVLTIDTINIDVPNEANGPKTVTYIEIPIGINYRLPLSDRTTLMLQPEVSFGYLLSQSGSYFTDELITSSNKSLIISGSLGVGVSHKLSEKLYLQGLARIRRPLGELNAEEVTIRKYTHVSFQFGLGYRF